MKDTDKLSRRNTVTYGDVRACEGMTVKEAAAHLDFDHHSFRWHVRAKKLSHLFEMNNDANYFMPKYKLTLERALSYNEMPIKDAANACNVNVSGFITRARVFGITSLFEASKRDHSRVKGSKNTPAEMEERKKANELGPELKVDYVRCLNSKCNELVRFEYWPDEKPSMNKFCHKCSIRPAIQHEDTVAGRLNHFRKHT